MICERDDPVDGGPGGSGNEPDPDRVVRDAPAAEENGPKGVPWQGPWDQVPHVLDGYWEGFERKYCSFKLWKKHH